MLLCFCPTRELTKSDNRPTSKFYFMYIYEIFDWKYRSVITLINIGYFKTSNLIVNIGEKLIQKLNL